MKESHTEVSPHNLISSVLAIKYSNWIGLLGGDTEKKSWDNILRRCGREWVSNAQFVKISHHGSETGSYEQLWNSIESENCDTVVTCFAAQGIPTGNGLRPIQEKGFPIYSTNSQLASQLVRGRGRVTSIAIPPSLETDGGEVRVSVGREGNADVDFFDAAGPLR